MSRPITYTTLIRHCGYASRMDVDVTLTCDPEAPATARAALRPLIPHLSEETHRDLQAVVSELVANAVKFGPDAPVKMAIQVGEYAAYGEIRDQGSGGIELNRRWTAATGGLGLQIVDALCDSWGAIPGQGRVWFEIVLDKTPS